MDLNLKIWTGEVIIFDKTYNIVSPTRLIKKYILIVRRLHHD